MKLRRPKKPTGQAYANVVFIEDDLGVKHCFSYDSEVAVITDENYIEFEGDNFYSKTSVMHKNLFKKFYNWEGK